MSQKKKQSHRPRKKNLPLLNYTTSLVVNQLEAHIIDITNIVSRHGTLLALIPTHAKDPAHDYTFMVIFTSTKPIQELCDSFMLPGILTRCDGADNMQTCTVQNHKPTARATTQDSSGQQTQKSTTRLLRFTADGCHFALPFHGVVKVLHCDQEHVSQTNNQYIYTWHTKPINAFFLVDLMPSGTQDACPPKLPKSVGWDRHNVIILAHHHKTIALIVDSILGKEEMTDIAHDDKLVTIINIEKLFELAQS